MEVSKLVHGLVLPTATQPGRRWQEGGVVHEARTALLASAEHAVVCDAGGSVGAAVMGGDHVAEMI
jgi:hypothetical protein